MPLFAVNVIETSAREVRVYVNAESPERAWDAAEAGEYVGDVVPLRDYDVIRRNAAAPREVAPRPAVAAAPAAADAA